MSTESLTRGGLATCGNCKFHVDEHFERPKVYCHRYPPTITPILVGIKEVTDPDNPGRVGRQPEVIYDISYPGVARDQIPCGEYGPDKRKLV